MDYFPIFLRLADEPVLVVGGGEVAARKIDLLLRTSAQVRSSHPSLSPASRSEQRRARSRTSRPRFSPEHLDGMRLAIAATDKRADQRVGRAPGRAP